MRQTEPPIESSKDIEDIHHPCLMSLLQELVREEGIMKATHVLEINYKTVASSMKTGRLSKQMRWALERLQYGESAPAVAWLERNLKLGDQLDELEEKLRGGLKDMKTALDELKEETARQLADLALGREGTAPGRPGSDESGGSGTRSGPPWWRPGGEAQHRVTDLIYEWRQARNSFIAAEERLSITLDRGTVADLAVRDEMAEAPAERRTARSRQLSEEENCPLTTS